MTFESYVPIVKWEGHGVILEILSDNSQVLEPCNS